MKKVFFNIENVIAYVLGYIIKYLPRYIKFNLYVILVKMSWKFPLRVRVLLSPFFMELGRISLDNGGPFWIKKNFEGFVMKLDISEKTQRNLFFMKVYEESLTKFIRKQIHNGDRFIDIGANVGYYTMLSSSLGTNTISCEPEKGNFNLLSNNSQLNGFKPNLRNIAIGSKKGNMTLHINPLNHGGNSLLPFLNYKTGIHGYSREDVEKKFGRENLEQEVLVDTIDSLVGSQNIKVIKIDVEGFESDVIFGMVETLKNKRVSYIICELSNIETRNSIIDMMDRVYGYSVNTVDNDGNLVSGDKGRDLVFAVR